MNRWDLRSAEERALLNPSFCCGLLWHAARGHIAVGQEALPLELVFLTLPLVLHRETRESLPHAVTTSLAVWIDEYPLLRTRVAERARMLAPFTREALIFGGIHRVLDFANGALMPTGVRKKSILDTFKASTSEVRDCAKRAEFTGRWFGRAGSPSTVMTLLGARP